MCTPYDCAEPTVFNPSTCQCDLDDSAIPE
jgi:hypothetical protein